MKLNELLKPWVKSVLPGLPLKSLHNDSRQVKEQSLFFAYPGTVSDGRLYIEQAMAAGAVALVYEPEQMPQSVHLPTNLLAIPLPGLAQKLAAIAARFYHEPSKKMQVTGVTGTNGKTTIAFQLAQAHSLLSKPAAYIGTIGEGQAFALNTIVNTTPDALCLQELFNRYQREQIQHVCMEVSSHALDQGRIDCIDFKQAIYTNLSLDHLDYHQNMQNYAQAKAKLFGLAGLEYAIINQDDLYASTMSAALPSSCQLFRYGIHEDCEVKALDWQISLSGTEIHLSSPWGNQTLHINALGFFNVYNALAIFSSLMLAGYSVKSVIEVMSQLKPAPGRMELVAKRPYILVDFAHTPDALEKVLNTLAEVKEGKILVVFGCGGDRDKSKRPIMGKIAATHADIAIMTSDNPRNEDPLAILQDIAQGIDQQVQIFKIVDREAAIAKALSLAEPADVIVVAGKGHEAYQQIGQVKHAFSDQEVIRRLRASI